MSTRASLEHAALLVVDVQVDFLPGGALAVAGGDEILSPIAALVRAGTFRDAIATQDWHPPGHISFASSHANKQPFEQITLYGEPQILWPDHCVAGSAGAALAADIPWERMRAIVRKGTDPAVDSYSALRNNWNAAHERPPTGLAGYLRECGVEAVYICGLTRDFCVQWSALDAADFGFATSVIWDLTRAVNAADDAAVASALTDAGVRIVESSRLR